MMVLVLLNVGWSLSALVYDLPAITTIPLWAIPFIVICPVYPLLLAIVWYGKWKHISLPNLLLALAILPASVYGLMAIPYYTTVMVQEGFSWNALLQIPWVLVYGIQGWYLLWTRKLTASSVVMVSVFLLTSLIVQELTDSFDYLGLSSLSTQSRYFLLAGGVLSVGICTLINQMGSSTKRS